VTARHRPKIGRAPAPDSLLDYAARNRHEIGPSAEQLADWAAAGLELPNLAAMRQYRINRLQEQLRISECDGALLHDPLMIRYATDTANMSVWTMHNEVRHCYVAADGPVVMFEFSKGEFLDAHSHVIDEFRPARSLHPFYVGNRVEEQAKRWGADMARLVREHARNDQPRLAIDTLTLEGVRALEAEGIAVIAGMQIFEDARVVKGPDELRAMRCAIDACNRNIDDMRSIFEPGVTEIELFATMQKSNMLRFGEWMECRILASGDRTNPWYQEASNKVVVAGEIMGFDTDMVGAYNMCVDISRSWLCGGGRPNSNQTDMYGRAKDMIEANIGEFRVGRSFRDITGDLSYPDPELFHGYTVLAHGVGLCDEYPSFFTREEWDDVGFDGELLEGTVLCVESFVGSKAGGEGVKLEEMILVTADGPELLSDYSMDLA